jgi:hypothetical protein
VLNWKNKTVPDAKSRTEIIIDGRLVGTLRKYVCLKWLWQRFSEVEPAENKTSRNGQAISDGFPTS